MRASAGKGEGASDLKFPDFRLGRGRRARARIMSMSKWEAKGNVGRALIIFLVLVVGFSVAAQPGGKVEHDWIYRTSVSNWYGIYQYTNYFPTGGRFTTVFFGRPLFTTHMQAETLVGIVILPILLGLVVFMWRRRRV
jgi:hypothetical protein